MFFIICINTQSLVRSIFNEKIPPKKQAQHTDNQKTANSANTLQSTLKFLIFNPSKHCTQQIIYFQYKTAIYTLVAHLTEQ